MKYFFALVMFIFALITVPVFSISDTFVEIYAGADQNHFGRALNRKTITKVNLNDFLASESLDCGSEGIETAVIIDYRVKNAFEKLLSDKDFYIIDNSIITRERSIGNDVYSFHWSLYGFNVVFSFEPTSAEIEKEIQLAYGNNGYLIGEVERSYKENYLIKIYCAENVLNRKDKKISFLEAMLSATVIGKTFQPLLGIHNGLGVLDRIGLSVAKENDNNDGNLYNYRAIEGDSKELFAFIHSVSKMNGDFVTNLYNSVKNITKELPEDDTVQLPEDFFRNKTGDSTDYALFFYDILKRKDYSVHFIFIDNGKNNKNLHSTVFFKEKETKTWGRIDVNELERNKTEEIKRLPSLIFSTTVKYFEPDLSELFNSKKIVMPPPSAWNKSLY